MTSSDRPGYYGSPILKRPVWTWEIPLYFAVGGTAGASAVLAQTARAIGDDELATASAYVAAVAGAASPVLLISDLGKPERFLNMLRVIRPTSPMNMGAWLLSMFVPSAIVSAVAERVGLPSWATGAARASAAATGAGMSAYTAVLVSDTAVPAWHEVRRRLPFHFAGSAMAAAGAAGVLVASDRHGLAAWTGIAGGISALVTERLVETHSPRTREAYGRGRAGRLGRMANACTALGVAGLALGGGRSLVRILGAGSLLAGAVVERFAVVQAGVQSAEDPNHVIGSQKRGGEGFTDVSLGTPSPRE